MKKYAITLVLLCALELVRSGYNNKAYRPIKTDDLLTPSDFLPIAKRLLEKVEYPGEGKGVVSSSKNYQQLADRLFQRFFFTNSRFSPVRLFDIAGLDSIQALALSGDEFNASTHFVPLTQNDFQKGLPSRCRYKIITRRVEPQKRGKGHHKKVISEREKLEKNKGKIMKAGHTGRKESTLKNNHTNTVENAKKIEKKRETFRQKREANSENSTSTVTVQKGNETNSRRNQPHIIPQAKNLLKKRVLVVKTDRKKREVKVKATTNSASNLKNGKRRMQRVTATGDQEDVLDQEEYVDEDDLRFQIMKDLPPLKIDQNKCYWQYKCPTTEGWIMFYCKLEPECAGSGSEHFIRDDIPIVHKADEHDVGFLRFRREVGVCLVDEEVEKIVERRYIFLIMPRKGKGNSDKDKAWKTKHSENLKLYFENLIFAQNQKTTTLAPPRKEGAKKNQHKYKYLRIANPYSDPKVQKQIREAQQIKMKEATEKKKESEKISSLQKGAVISYTTPFTTPLPNFMGVTNKKK